jgi:hypothetical protein
MPMLFVECHACGTEFASGIAPSVDTPGGVALFNVLEKCPKCGDISPYNTHEFRLPGPAPVTPPPGGVSVPPANTEALERSNEDHSDTPAVDAPEGEPPAGR